MNKVFFRSALTLVTLQVGLSFSIYAQSLTPEQQVDRLMEKAIKLMADGRYEDANVTFREILKQKAVLPTDLSYLFAETLYMIHQYHNSQNFLDKYLRLAGPTGKYYPQAMDLKHYLDDEIEDILTCSFCDATGYRLVACDVCNQAGVLTEECYYCHAVGVNLCEVCKGNGVTTSLNAFSEVQYHTCPNCQGKGQVPCKVCQGKKVTTETCPTCHGTRFKAGIQICDHQEVLLEE